MTSPTPSGHLRDDPSFLRYYARVMIREARARRGTEFAQFLLSCASRARRQAIANAKPVQGDLFSSLNAKEEVA